MLMRSRLLWDGEEMIDDVMWCLVVRWAGGTC